MTSGSLRDNRVRAFLVAEAISAVGSFATFMAIWWFATDRFDASASEVSFFGVAFIAPAVVLGPITGTAVDRFGPRNVLAVAKAAGVLASLALLLADDYLTLAALSILHGIVHAFTLPALQSLPPRIVRDDELARTNALVGLTDEFSIVAGPIVGVLAIEAFGFRGAFVVDACTYAIGLAVLPLVRIRATSPSGDEHEAAAAVPGFRDAFDGARLIARTPILRRIVATTATVHFLWGAALVAEPLYVRDVLEESKGVFAALQTVFGIMLVGGGLLVARIGERMATFGWVCVGVGASGVTAALYLGTSSIVVAFAGVSLWGLVTALMSGPTRTLLQRHAEEILHGRVMATDLVAGSTAELGGVLATGLLVGIIGVSNAFIAFGIVVVLVAVRLAVADRRSDVLAAPVPQPSEAGAAR